VRLGTALYWDALRLWSEIQAGLGKFRALHGPGRAAAPAGIGVDAWGVDYCLLDGHDQLVGNPHHYRDGRTHGVPEKLSDLLTPLELFRATGNQTSEINTAIQLASMVMRGDPQLASAQTLLTMPDFFSFLLCGEKRVEYTEATTTQLYNMRAKRWSRETMSAFGIPSHIFPEVVFPGTVLGEVRTSVLNDLGFASAFPCIAVGSHDTASAVAAIPELDHASVFLSSGTWSLIGVAVAEPNLSDAAFEGGFTNEGAADGTVLLMKNLTGLWILQECLRVWEAAGRRYEWAEIVQAAKESAPFRAFIDPSDAAFLAPANMPAAVREWSAKSGQAAPQSAGEVARCVFESLSFAYREVIEDLERITQRKLTTVRLVGGGCLNRFLCKMTADASGRTVIAGPVEAAALGNAMAQAVAVGALHGLEDGRAAVGASIQRETFEPEGQEGWDEGFARYRAVVTGVRQRAGGGR
jgi:rhamnulokinase